MLEINGKAVHRQESGIGRLGLLRVMRELEAKDITVFIQKLVDLAKSPRKRFTFDDADSNMHDIADFLR